MKKKKMKKKERNMCLHLKSAIKRFWYGKTSLISIPNPHNCFLKSFMAIETEFIFKRFSSTKS